MTGHAARSSGRPARGISVRAVTGEAWNDFARLFEARGSPHYCWCTPYRLRDKHQASAAQKKQCMRKLVQAETPIGVLAYDGDEPVGWCSIAPRETYVKLERSRTMPRKTPPATPTWTLLCFFVARPYRKTGLARALLEGAVDYARAQGATIVEGYPFDTAGISSTHHGHSSLFKAAHFRQDVGDRRWSLALDRRGR
jgi:GNAT superfamily N-acetyltransferase